MEPKEIRKRINFEGARLIIQSSIESKDTFNEMVKKAEEAGVCIELMETPLVLFLSAADKDSDMITNQGHTQKRGKLKTIPSSGTKLKIVVDALNENISLTNQKIRDALEKESPGCTPANLSTMLNALKKRGIIDNNGHGIWRLTNEARIALVTKVMIS